MKGIERMGIEGDGGKGLKRRPLAALDGKRRKGAIGLGFGGDRPGLGGGSRLGLGPSQRREKNRRPSRLD